MLSPPDINLGHGSGSSLPLPVLVLAGISTIVAVAVSGISIWLQLRNYRKPLLQRMVVRILLMVPLYAVSSLISLFSLEAAFFIDAIRDIYEAFVIYCFFVLLLEYLGGERSLLILLHGRPPIPAIFPASLWHSETDPSDPYTFLFLKRSILQYVQVKPLFALACLIMKATGTYNEGDLLAGGGYLYVSIVYNLSLCLALWSLAVFWTCVQEDLKPFRPLPKFLCIKGILLFSFWQSIIVSLLVAAGIITRLGPYTDSEHISLGLSDTLICIEMPFFAAGHLYAFSYRDFIQPSASAAGKGRASMYVARMTLWYAFRDAFGFKDLVEDTRATLRGEGINYRAFEPSEGGMHIGAARDRRIRAGLRYAAGGKHKYWLPEVRADNDSDITAPLFAADADDVVHDAPDMRRQHGVVQLPGGDADAEDEDEYALTFGDALVGPGSGDDVLYEHAKMYVFGDYLYPVVDVSSEEARWAMWKEEERVVREITSGEFGGREVACSGYGATQSGARRARMYDDDDDDEDGAHDAGSGAGRAHSDHQHPPSSVATSPPRSRATSDCPPTTSGCRTPPHQTPFDSPPGVLSRLHLPHLTRLRSSSRASSSRSASPPPLRVSRRPLHAPLVKEDAVDLVVSAPDGLHASSTSKLVQVWDELGPSAGSGSGLAPPTRTVVDEDKDRGGGEGDRRGVASDVQFVVTTDDDVGTGYEDDAERVDVVVRKASRTPLAYAHAGGYALGIPEAEDNHNPWA